MKRNDSVDFVDYTDLTRGTTTASPFLSRMSPGDDNATMKVLTVGDGDLTLSLALARAYGKHLKVTASVLDTREKLLESFPDAPLQELKDLSVEVLFQLDATQLHRQFSPNHWDLVLFHHPHLGLASLQVDEAEHATRHFRLLSHYLHSASACARLVHVCLCGTQPQTWQLSKATERQNLQLLRTMSTSVPFSKIWTQEPLEPGACPSHFAAPRRYRNGKLGSRHFLGKWGYRHRRTAGESYDGAASDMNVAGSHHYVFGPNTEGASRSYPSPAALNCPICGDTFSQREELDQHLQSPAIPEVAEKSNKEVATAVSRKRPIPLEQGTLPKDAAPEEPKLDDTNARLVLVSSSDSGKRLRAFVQRTFGLSKSQAEKAIQDGYVQVNHEVVSDSSRILQDGMTVTWIPKESASTDSTDDDIEIVKQVSQNILVVSKPSGMRTKGAMEGTLEHAVSKQAGGRSFVSLSKLDTSCFGLCVMQAMDSIESKELPVIRHRLIILVHGRVPDDWFPHREIDVEVQGKWSKRKQGQEEALLQERVRLIPLERTDLQSKNQSDVGLSTLLVDTNYPSSASICQWMRREGYPVVGDRNCRKEYLQLKRSIRNRIKDKVCIGCYQVEWRDDKAATVCIPQDYSIPEKLSARYWEDNFLGEPEKNHTCTEKSDSLSHLPTVAPMD